MISKRASQQAESSSGPTPGGFRSDGSWSWDGTPPSDRDPRRHLYWFIDMLVTKRRREPELQPAVFAERIKRSRWPHAFPNLGQWVTNPPWPIVWTSTPAEETVKRCGQGASAQGQPRHWCGNDWVQGEEFGCPNLNHRRHGIVEPSEPQATEVHGWEEVDAPDELSF